MKYEGAIIDRVIGVCIEDGKVIKVECIAKNGDESAFCDFVLDEPSTFHFVMREQ
jgi:hypothetical protein